MIIMDLLKSILNKILNFKKLKKKTKDSVYLAVFAFFFLLWWEIFVPAELIPRTAEPFLVKKGQSDSQIAKNLEEQGIIRSSYFFRIYVTVFGMHANLRAGKYSLSGSMSLYKIAKRIVSGDVIKEKMTFIEGWDAKDIARYLAQKQLYSKEKFLNSVSKDYTEEFTFLSDKPKELSVEGYLFPDTYEISSDESADDVVKNMLANFDKKVTPDIRQQIAEQKKSVFEIITMASIIEKEVRNMDDKKIISGILWKRIRVGMPLQVDSTINYITRKDDPGVAIKDTKVDSLYNTYKYKGLPLGPISNPGLDSIMAAIYPKETSYWFYLSASSGKTIFSETLEQHNIAAVKYLN